MRKIHQSGMVEFFDSFVAILTSSLSLFFLINHIQLNSAVGITASVLFLLVFFISILIEYRFSIRLIKYSPAILLFFIAIHLVTSTSHYGPLNALDVLVLVAAVVVPFFFQMTLKADRIASHQKLFWTSYSLYFLLFTSFLLYIFTVFELLYWITVVAIVSLYSLMAVSLKKIQSFKSPAKLKSPFIVYMSAPPSSGYQLKMWLTYLQQLSPVFYVIVREKHLFLEVSKYFMESRVIYVTSLDQLNNLISQDVKAVFYVNNACRNADMVRHRGAKHILLLHGDSEKEASYNPISAMYDYLYVAGQVALERYKVHGVDIPEKKFVKIGRPQLIDLKAVDSKPSSKKILKTVLYAPSWEGISQVANHSSLAQAEKLIQLLLNFGFRVIFRPHPLSVKQKKVQSIVQSIQSSLTIETKNRFIFSNPVAVPSFSVYEDMNQSDLLVSDNSSVLNDYLTTMKPFIVIDVQDNFVDSRVENHISSAAYIIGKDLAGLTKVLISIVEHDPLKKQRKATKKFYIDQCINSDGELKFLSEAKRVIKGDITI
ncbi:CDP-glycerol glycerophosphotransferase family protein [Candidatus Thioglobus sp.]|nr:CDP-glycerol glycerophosphotransferase family protein [Candidatus Thioglobus sp.]